MKWYTNAEEKTERNRVVFGVGSRLSCVGCGKVKLGSTVVFISRANALEEWTDVFVVSVIRIGNATILKGVHRHTHPSPGVPFIQPISRATFTILLRYRTRA